MNRDALVVGINKYPFLKDSATGNYKHLTTPASDAEAIAQLLEAYANFQVKRFPASIVNGKLQVDPDKPFKTEELEQAILNLFLPETEKPPETALLFFAGHGLRKQLRPNLTQGFLGVSDSYPSKNQWGFSLQLLWDILQRSQVKQQIIWLDCCFSGELLNFKDTELGRQSSGCDRFLIAASRDYEVAYQQLDSKHGVFTGALLAGLNPHLVPEGDWITNRTLAVSVEQKLQAYYEQTKIPQTPLISNHGEVIKLVQGKAKPYEEVTIGNTSKQQLQILLHWLIQLLEDDAIESIQVDSTAIPGKNLSLAANNIVVFYKDGNSSFIQTQDTENWEHQNQIDLERLVPNSKLAMLVLERYIQNNNHNNNTHLRDTKYKITRSDILAELAKHELNPTPKRSEAEILTNFNSASSIGRYWLREIDGKKISRSELPQIIELIEQGSRTILLIDRPGSGKTCMLLDLADNIEHEKASVWGLLFIKGDNFTNVSSEQELTAHGLPEDIIGQCARLADYRKVVVIIDSLDVLSLSRQHGSLKVFLGIIDRLEKLEKVTVIVACRNFDLEYDPLLRGRSWQHKINLQPLDFDNQVKSFLIDWQVDVSKMTPILRSLLQIPQNLRIYERLAKLGVSSQPASAYELYNSFLEEVVVKNSTLGTEAIDALQNMAEQLMQQRTQSYSKVSFGASEDTVRQLISQEVLLETSPGILEFSHKTLADCLTVRATRAKNQTLAQFILEHPQLPFIRPAVRAFFFYLRAYQPDAFRRQVWEVLSHDEIAYHVKRLVSESFAEIEPVEEDWRSLRRIFQNYPDLFRRLLWRANNGTWWNIITQHWLPEAKLAQERETWLLQFIHWLGAWMNKYPAEIVAFWRQAIAEQWANPQNLAGSIRSMLNNFEAWDTPGIQELLETLIEDFEIEEHDILGRLLSRWVQSTNSGDILLWKYITKNVLPEDVRNWDFRNKLHCQPHEFHQENFLAERLKQSDLLLTLALNQMEGCRELLSLTSWGLQHSQGVIHSVDSLTFLLHSLETALKFRSRKNDTWWQTNEPRLRTIEIDFIRYFVTQAYKENIEANIPGIENLLQDEKLFRWSQIKYELGELMNMAYPYISESIRLANQTIILSLCSERKKYEEEFSCWAYREFYNFFLWIPSIFRFPEIQAFIETWQNCFGYSRPEPDIHNWSGWVMPPLSSQDLLKLSNKGLFQLLNYYKAHEHRNIFNRDMIGGFSEVKVVLRDACSLQPEKFIGLFTSFIQENLHQDYVCALVEGITFHLRYRFGNVRPAQQWEPIEPLPEGEAIASILLNWLERYFIIWEEGQIVRYALEACCDVITDSESAERLSLLLFWLYSKYPEDRKIRENSHDLLTTAINSVHGVAAESAIKLCNRLLEKEQPVPNLLLLLLRHAARDAAIYVRVPVLQSLPFLMYKKPDLGWQLLADVFKEPQPYLWKYTERCFYYQYHNNFDKVAPYLNRLLQEGMEEAGDIWGRLSALASLAGHISQEQLFATLVKTNSNAAWEGVTQVFIANLELKEHTENCITGLINVLGYKNISQDIIGKIDRCFEEETKRACIRREFALAFLEALPASARDIDFDGFLEWLGYESRRNPLSALELTETLAAKFESRMNVNLLWRTEPLIAALNEILREADETDDPKLIQRAINLQDSFLKLDMRGMEELLNKAGQD
jgi:Caspase domain/ATPase family associated with various cellular activities (AAA)